MMLHARPRLVGTAFLAALLAHAPAVRAQSVEVAPFYGYLFGNDLFEAFTGPLDVDGAAAIGVIADVPTPYGFQVEALYSHQSADAAVLLGTPGRPVPLRVSVDHFQGGGLQEFSGGRVRPFLNGTFGLTHFAIEDDHEVRFTLGAGGGVKLLPAPHVGVRLDGRVFATFIDADASTIACARGTCLLGLHVNIAWQAVFTAAVLVRFP